MPDYLNGGLSDSPGENAAGANGLTPAGASTGGPAGTNQPADGANQPENGGASLDMDDLEARLRRLKGL